MSAINAILVAEKKVSILSFSGSISCPIVGKIAQFWYNYFSIDGTVFSRKITTWFSHRLTRIYVKEGLLVCESLWLSYSLKKQEPPITNQWRPLIISRQDNPTLTVSITVMTS